MPYKFNFIDNERNHSFSCKLESNRCAFTLANGNRCKKKVIIGEPYCYIHYLYKHHLKIGPSNISGAGKGLFAIDKSQPQNAIIFKKNQRITEYKGEILTRNELEDRYGNKTAPYGLAINHNAYEDCACRRRIGSLSNTGNKKRDNNAQFYLYRGRPYIKAIKNIYNGEEILTNYGDSYKFNEDTEFSTKPVFYHKR